METKVPKISVVIPIHNMANGAFFLWRAVNSIMDQSFKDYEIVIVREGEMAKNTNEGIKRARGEIIKILFLDDFLFKEDALQKIVKAFTNDINWVVSGCVHIGVDNSIYNTHIPCYTKEVKRGVNTIGSPSVLAFRNKYPLLFNESLTWVLDCELYGRLYDKFGYPGIIEESLVAIGIGDHQTTNILSNEIKLKEQNYILQKHENR